MKKFAQNFLKFVLTIFAMVLSWIILSGLIDYKTNIYTFNPIFLGIGICLYILTITFLYKYVFKRIEKFKYVEYIMFILFFVIATFIGLYFRLDIQGPQGKWDMGTCFEIADEWVREGTYTNTFYPSQFPNNIMMIVIDSVILTGFKIVGIDDFIRGITIVDAIVVSLSVILSFFIVKKILDRKKALLYMFIALLTTPLYLFVAEYYTDTYSMLTAVLLFYFWLILRDGKKKKITKFLLCMLYAVILFFAIKIKVTSAFVFIAILFYELVQGEYMLVLKRYICIVPITACLIILFNVTVVNKLAPAENRDRNEVPTEHWIMMGMNGVGSFSYEEYAITLAPENVTYAQRRDVARKTIIERLKTRSADEHIKNLNAKLGFAWHDGTFWAYRVLRIGPIKEGTLHKYVLVDYEESKYYKYIPQTLHFAMLIFIFFNVCRIIREKNWKTKEIIPIVTMIGYMIFLLIWENRSRYLVNIIPIMLMAQINGIDFVADRIYKKKDKVIKGDKK